MISRNSSRTGSRLPRFSMSWASLRVLAPKRLFHPLDGFLQRRDRFRGSGKPWSLRRGAIWLRGSFGRRGFAGSTAQAPFPQRLAGDAASGALVCANDIGRREHCGNNHHGGKQAAQNKRIWHGLSVEPMLPVRPALGEVEIPF